MPVTGAPRACPLSHSHRLPDPMRFCFSRRLKIAFGGSFLLHLAALFLIGDSWERSEHARVFHARLAQPSRFEPRRLRGGKLDPLPPRDMEFRRQAAAPRDMPGSHLALPDLPDIEVYGPGVPWVRMEAGQPPDSFATAPAEDMPSPGAYGRRRSDERQALDLLRMQDMARAGRFHALSMADPTTRRGLRGYLNIARVKVYGAGSDTPSVHALARYMRDYTRILAQVHPQAHSYFLDEDLLKDPIHFLIQGAGLTLHTDYPLTRFTEGEQELLGKYLRGGGFLFIEGSYRFLEEMADNLRRILGVDGRLYPLPVSHDLYHAYYDFDSGFPGEVKQAGPELPGDAWYYPANTRFDVVEEEVPIDPDLVDPEPRLPALGIWGLEVEGEVVAVLSDLGMAARWGESFNTTGVETGAEPHLRAGTNIVVYAMTREGGSAVKAERPAWAISRPTVGVGLPEPTAEYSGIGDPELAAGAAELVGDLDASLAVVLSPLGSVVAGRVEVRLDGRYTVDLRQGSMHGIILHNLPPGDHWLVVDYGGKRRELDVVLEGGAVSTVTFALSRLAVFTRLRVRQEDGRIDIADWLRRFDDLIIEEVFLGEDRQRLEETGSFR